MVFLVVVVAAFRQARHTNRKSKFVNKIELELDLGDGTAAERYVQYTHTRAHTDIHTHRHTYAQVQRRRRAHAAELSLGAPGRPALTRRRSKIEASSVFMANFTVFVFIVRSIVILHCSEVHCFIILLH